ncbi:YigZ family protein [Halanaerocella petrolearia]
MTDKYQTISQGMRIKTKIKKCKFITSIKNVNTVNKAEEFIDQVSEDFTDATHNVFAFKIGLGDKSVTRSSDDGEPSGSSGPPALQALEGANITNVAVVITRYFGGVKHGVGGLIRAYGGCVRQAIEETKIIEKTRYIKLKVSVPYSQMGQVINDLEGHTGQVIDTTYTNEGAEVIALLQPSFVTEFKDRITEATKGQSEFKKEGDVFK